VPVEQERWAVSVPEATDHVVAAVVGGLWHAGERVIADPVGDREALDLEAEPLQLLLDDGLRLVLDADGALSSDELLKEGERGLGAPLDRGVELLRVQTAAPSMVECLVQIPDDTPARDGARPNGALPPMFGA
jgi:hypothetical protein